MLHADPEATSVPIARVRVDALLDNADGLLADDADAVADLRADAWGHGVGLVAGALALLGVRRALVDAQGAGLLPVGVEPVRVPAMLDAATLDAEALFGLPGAGTRPVLALTGSVLSTKRLRAGEGVSYGYRHRAPQDTRIALVTGGYAQGVVRALGGRASLTSRDGTRLPLVGRVAMDVSVVEIGETPLARGERVTFFGDPERGEPGLAEWAAATGLSAAEIVAVAGARARRVAS